MNICSNQCSFICILKLVCISRTSDTVWSSKSVMSVSFATLVSPTQVESVSAVDRSAAVIQYLSATFGFQVSFHQVVAVIFALRC